MATPSSRGFASWPALRISLELAQVESMRGSLKGREDCVRLSNMIMRREAELRSRSAVTKKDTSPSIEASSHVTGGGSDGASA